MGKADAVGVDHDVPDPAVLCERHELGQLGMQGWLAARELHHLG